MKKIKIFITILISILLIILTKNSSSVASTTYNSLADFNSAKQSGKVSAGDTVTIKQSDLFSSGSGLYCLELNQDILNNNGAEYTYVVKDVVDVGGEDSTLEQKVLAEILSGKYGGNYGDAYTLENTSDAQKALWSLITSTGGEALGLGDLTSADYSGGNDKVNEILNIIQNVLENGESPASAQTSGGEEETVSTFSTRNAIQRASASATSTASVFVLESADGTAAQKLGAVEPEPVEYPEPEPDYPEPEEPEPEVPEVTKGYVTISGKVWADAFSGKGNDNDNSSGGGEGGVPNVKVTWKSGGGVLGSATTGASGQYSMRTSIEIGEHPYRISKSDWEKINNSYVEFEYNGLKYISVAPGSGSNGSKAIEIESERKALDAKFMEITKDQVKNSGIRLSYRRSANKSELEQIVNPYADYSQFKVTATTDGVIGNLMQQYASESKSEKVCVKHCYYKKNPGINYGSWLLDADGTPFSGEGVITNVDHNKKHEMYGGVYCCGHQHEYEDYYYEYDDDGEREKIYYTYYEYCDKGHKSCDKVGHPACLVKENGIQSRPVAWSIDNINLGLVVKEQPDMAITSDVDEVRVIMKGQEYTYKYNTRGIGQNSAADKLFENMYKVQFQQKYSVNEYRRPVNPSDISYVVANGTEDMQVYVKYKMVVKNQSETLPMAVKEIVNYYDQNYTLVSSGWQTSSKYGLSYSGNGFNAVYKQINETLQPGKTSSVYEIEFKVKDATVKALINDATTSHENPQGILLQNISEILTYSTYYGSSTLCSNGKRGGSGTYAGIDKDSAPGNATPGSPSTYEDDTDQAPAFRLYKDPDYKIISGTVYEDKSSLTDDGQRLGNGLDDGENRVQNAKVELLRVLEDGSVEPAKIYRVENANPVAYDAVAYSDENGNYNFTGVVVDNYIIRYTYGNRITTSTNVDQSDSIEQSILEKPTTINGNEINARNYKSTIITTEPVKSAMKVGGTDKWHLTTQDKASVAVDYLEKRKAIEDLTYRNFDKPVNMTAYTKSFKVQVEYTADQYEDVENDGITKKGTDIQFEHEWPMFDFGITERAREDIVIDKTISNLKITLANGQVLTEGIPYEEKLNYVKALGTKDVKTRDQALKANEKLLYIEMDSELIQGARLDIIYKITVTNNSEIDYEYDYEYVYGDSDMAQYSTQFITEDARAYYYYYAEQPTTLIQPTVKGVIDYLDPELTCMVGDEINTADINRINAQKYTYKESPNTAEVEKYRWEQIKPIESNGTTISPATQLREQGLISENTKNKLEEEKYLVFKTNYFYDVTRGQSKSLELFASKLLANQAEDYVYENHVEIIEIDGKIARTIDSVEDDGKQVTKTYKPGTYIPSLDRINANKPVDGTIELAGLHNQDDDMVRIVITPPTGLENNTIMYITIGAIGLIAMAGGIYFIKKKIIG